MPWLIGIGVVIGLVVVWWLLFRIAIKNPNPESLKGTPPRDAA